VITNNFSGIKLGKKKNHNLYKIISEKKTLIFIDSGFQEYCNQLETVRLQILILWDKNANPSSDE